MFITCIRRIDACCVGWPFDPTAKQEIDLHMIGCNRSTTIKLVGCETTLILLYSAITMAVVLSLMVKRRAGIILDIIALSHLATSMEKQKRESGIACNPFDRHHQPVDSSGQNRLQSANSSDPLGELFQCHGPDANARQADLRLDPKRNKGSDTPIIVARPAWQEQANRKNNIRRP